MSHRKSFVGKDTNHARNRNRQDIRLQAGHSLDAFQSGATDLRGVMCSFAWHGSLESEVAGLNLAMCLVAVLVGPKSEATLAPGGQGRVSWCRHRDCWIGIK